MKIELKDVSFSYGTHNVLNDFNLTINNNEMVAILGHNGSGKSTLAKLIMGLLEISSGHIYINDVEMKEETVDSLRKHLAIIFQNPDNQFVGSTVKDDIAFGLENHQIPRKQMLELIEKYSKLVNMENFLNVAPDELSGGQKQRVAIAGALAMETDVIIFDESTSMLDPLGTKEINETIKELASLHNKTIITITHNIEEALYADRIIVLNKGKIVLDGAPIDVLKEKEILEDSGLLLIDSLAIINNLKDDPKYKNVVDKLWELTFKM